MIDWAGVAGNLAWIVGLALVLAGISMGGYLARRQRAGLRSILRRPGPRLACDAGLALFCLGLALTGRRWWEQVAWGLATTVAAVAAVRSVGRVAPGSAEGLDVPETSSSPGDGWARRVARRVAGVELWVVGLGVAPVLIFAAYVPRALVFAALAAIPALWLARWIGRGSPARPTPLDAPLVILLLIVPLGVWAALDRSVALPEAYRVVLGLALLYAVANGMTTARRLGTVQTLMLPAIATLCLVALGGTLWATWKLPLPGLARLYERLPGGLRTFWNPDGFSGNIVGGILAILLPLAAASALGARRLWLKAGWAAVMLGGGLILILTQSRGAIVALAVALVAMAVIWNRRLLAGLPVLAIGGLAAAWLLARSAQVSLAAAQATAMGSLDERLELWSRVLFMLRDFPLTGIGLGMFDRVLDTLYPLFLSPSRSTLFHPHNIFLAAAVDGGIPGLVAFLALIGLLLAMSVQSIRMAGSGPLRGLAFGLFGALVAYVTHGLSDSITSFIKASSIVWALFGLEAALWLHLRESRVEGEQATD